MNPLAFQSPCVAIQARTSPVLAGVPGEMDAGRARLGRVAGQVAQAVSPLAGAACVAADLRHQVEALVQAGGCFACVHPYLHPLGDRRGNYSYLTPEAAVQGMAARLADPEDPLPEGVELGAVFVLLCARDNARFFGALEAFNRIFPVTELAMTMRRAKSLASLETDKFICPAGKVWPEWLELAPARHATLRRLDTALGDQVAVVEGYAAQGVTPEAELQAVMQRKTQQAAHVQAAWDDLADLLQGEAGQAMYCQGSGAAIHSQLSKANVPGPENVLSALVGWIGEPDRLKVLREVFGI